MARYDAFISYSHAADAAMAARLEAEVQRFAKPWYKLRQLALFRDGNDLNLTPHLQGAIEAALNEARHLVLLASPESARSEWCGLEVAHWLQQRGMDGLVLVITGGQFRWDGQVGDIDWTHTDCIPRALAGRYSGEPFFLDMRWAREPGAELDLRDPRFAQAVALLSATLHGRSVGDMVGEEVEQHRRTVRWRNGAIVSLALLLATALGAAWVAEQQRRTAVAERDRAESITLLTRARAALQAGKLAEAVRVALAARERHPAQPASEQAMNAVALHADAAMQAIGGAAPHVRALDVAADGQRLLVVAAANRNDGAVSEARLVDAEGRELAVQSPVGRARLVDGGRAWLRSVPGAPGLLRQNDGSTCQVIETFELWRTGTQRAERMLERDLVDISADGRRSLHLCGTRLRLVDAEGSERTARVPGALAAWLTPDGGRVAVELRDSVLLIDARGWAPGAADPPGVLLRGNRPVFAADGLRVGTRIGAGSALWQADGRLLDERQGAVSAVGPGAAWFTETPTGTQRWIPGSATAARLPGAGVQVSADGRWVLTRSAADNALHVATATGHALATLPGTDGRFSPLGPSVLAANADGRVTQWDMRRLPLQTPAAAAQLWAGADLAAMERLAAAARLPVPAHGSCDLSGAVCAPDGRGWVGIQLGAVTPELAGALTLTLSVTGADGAPVNVPLSGAPACPAKGLQPIAFSPQPGGPWAIACSDGQVHLFGRDGRFQRTLSSAGPATALAWLPGGRLLVAGDDRVPRVVSLQTGQALLTLAVHESPIVQAVADPAGRRIATLTRSGIARVWTLGEGPPQLHGEVRAAGSPLAVLQIDDEARWLYAARSDGTLQRWLLDAGRDLASEYPWLAAEPADQR